MGFNFMGFAYYGLLNMQIYLCGLCYFNKTKSKFDLMLSIVSIWSLNFLVLCQFGL